MCGFLHNYYYNLKIKRNQSLPIAIEEDYSIGRLKVQPEATCTRAENEDKVGRVLGIELAQQVGPVFRFRRSVQPKVGEALVSEEVLENRDELRHLTEYQHFVPGSLELGQDVIQQIKLASRPHNISVDVPVFSFVEQIRVIADLAQLHEGIHQALHIMFTVKADQ